MERLVRVDVLELHRQRPRQPLGEGVDDHLGTLGRRLDLAEEPCGVYLAGRAVLGPARELAEAGEERSLQDLRRLERPCEEADRGLEAHNHLTPVAFRMVRRVAADIEQR